MVVDFWLVNLSPRGLATKISYRVDAIWGRFGGSVAGIIAQLFNDK